MDIKSTFAKRLRELRGTTSQTAFGEKIGISRASVSYYETGKRTADIEILSKICTAYAVSADWLLGISNARTADTTVQEVCAYTGLTEMAVGRLDLMSKAIGGEKGHAIDVINALLESDQFQELVQKILEYKSAVEAETIWVLLHESKAPAGKLQEAAQLDPFYSKFFKYITSFQTTDNISDAPWAELNDNWGNIKISEVKKYSTNQLFNSIVDNFVDREVDASNYRITQCKAGADNGKYTED